ncbi:unnamed protein product [Zymoseptoria tritici ST99CH_1A5]|uniref:DNA-directed RNA polymerase n=2 Tax=Zymoseptoria tritici TaxID=1047171 RepID=A0A1X7S3H2_ZYMT9|nr:unnamed protein product [Zymoseptoria tritici ST99CH_3D7]SMR61640.1 unnamed protein product [Zymoseptoria tritici ST99CH_3D1]SMY27852.1 unnamed protein product [Zymoseptoria tritici ST99CH_1A5]
MLVRSAGRRQRRQTSQILAASFAQLYLPWLAPAQLQWSAARSSSSSSSTPTLRRNAPRTPTRPRTRALATAADHHIVPTDSRIPPIGYGSGFRDATYDPHIPFDFARDGRVGFSGLGVHHPEPLMVPPQIGPEPAIVKIGGLNFAARDTLTHLVTSLSVGRRDRATAIVQRLSEKCARDAPELLLAHTVYLEDSLRLVMAHGRDSPQSHVILKEMHRWFEVEMREKGIPLEASMIVTMLRAVIRTLSGSRRDRSIRRYADLASQLGPEMLENVLESEEYDDNEFAILGRATVEYYEDFEEEAMPSREEAEQAIEDGVATQHHEYVDLVNTPEVLATQQKGEGLKGIKRTMDVFKDFPPLPPTATTEEKENRAAQRQIALERTSVEVAVERWKKADEELRKKGISTAMQTKDMSSMMWQWHQQLLPALKQELEEVQKEMADPGREHDRHLYGPFLELLPLEHIAATTIMVAMSSIAHGKKDTSGQYETDVKLSHLVSALGNTIESDCKAEKAGSQSRRGAKKARSAGRLKKSAANPALEAPDADKTSASKGKPKKPSNKELLAELEWSNPVKFKLGAMLISKLVETAKLACRREHPRTKEMIEQMQPALLHQMKWIRGKRQGTIAPNVELVKKLSSEPIPALIAKRMPMVVRPKPWKGWEDGGYLRFPSPILRLPVGDKQGKSYFLAAAERNEGKDLETVYRGLTALSSVPWRVHPGVFKVQLDAWNSGEEIANFAPLRPATDLPPEPESTDFAERRKWLAQCHEIRNKATGLHSKRCFQNFQLEIARTIVNETIYFPHNLDFRGRAYPIPPYLNHMGADNVRGLLVFADGKELGEKGLRWLKTHLATVAGHDKASMQERLDFTEAHLDDIYDSVRNPLTGRRWWLEADDAWQTLAACFELTAALDSPDPTKFVSHLPVQQDGTCNGLQHYAALGGDRAGAAQVNLEPSDRPADVYTAVADAVKAEVDKDAAEGNLVAQVLQGRLTRKCVKQPVMTNVYGVTFYGAKEQVRKQLEVLFPEVGPYGPVNMGNMSHYVATKIFKSLGDMFKGAQSIQAWLGQCADRISTSLTPAQVEELKVTQGTAGKRSRVGKRKPGRRSKAEQAEEETSTAAPTPAPSNPVLDTLASDVNKTKPLFKQTVVWTTPLKLPVVQPYRASKPRTVSTTMQTIAIQEQHVWDPVSKRKQLQAFPPNFIHSLDATHMLLSALKCTEEGMTFASIHDSFWTHACDVDDMSRVLRDAFVTMHREDIVGRLREEFQARYKGFMYMASVVAQSPVGRKIAACRAKLRKDETLKMSELALEAERMRLKGSEDAEERRRGEEMVTPGSIFESEGDGEAFLMPSEMAGQRLGELPGGGKKSKTAVDGDDGTARTADIEETNVDADVLAADLESHDLPDELPDGGDALEASADEASTEPATEKKKNKTPTKRPTPRKIHVWLPLTFPEVPEKGDFDVRRLMESRYFFH